MPFLLSSAHSLCKKLTVLAFFSLVTVSPFARAGTKDGGGGDAILCRNGKLYSWDFIQTQTEPHGIAQDLYKNSSAKQILGLVEERLQRLNPFLAESLSSFSESRENSHGLKLRDGPYRTWVKGIHSLRDIPDETTKRIPRACAGTDDKILIKKRIYQAVIRTEKLLDERENRPILATGDGVLVTYDYDQRLLARLESNGAIQLSFLLLHEWLRDFTEDEELIAQAVKFLHGEELRTLLPEDFAWILRTRYRLKFPELKTGELFSLVGGTKTNQERGLVPESASRRAQVSVEDGLYVLRFDAEQLQGVFSDGTNYVLEIPEATVFLSRRGPLSGEGKALLLGELKAILKPAVPSFGAPTDVKIGVTVHPSSKVLVDGNSIEGVQVDYYLRRLEKEGNAGFTLCPKEGRSCGLLSRVFIHY